ncbi:MAG: PP2C family protein-serine/threonine phosphatase [Gammaproteobacteria bacterium]|nr:PP2C family protein-serine/threonine phosphatase [Gammaproteobacteria bacterium]
MTLTIGVICASIIFVGLEREELIKDQFARESVSDQISLWNKIKNEIIQQMEASEMLVTDNSELIGAIGRQDTASIQSLGRGMFERLNEEGAIGRFDLVYADGSLAFSSLPTVFQSPAIASGIAKTNIEDGTVARGIGNDAQRNTGVVYGFPLYSSREIPVGMAIFFTDMLMAIEEMERVTDSSVVFVNRRGRLISSSDRTLWGKLRKQIDLRNIDMLQTIRVEDQYFSVSVLPQNAELSGLLGRIVIVRDITGLIARQQAISTPSAFVIGGLLLVLLIGLNYYMSRAFSPLAESVRVLNALSKGDLQAQIEDSVSDGNEVGQISNAISRFRIDLVTLNRFRRSRERQQARQKRFIIREMTGLSETLDGEEREKVLHELEKLRSIVQETPTDFDQQARALHNLSEDAEEDAKPPDSMAMMAIAFQHMSGRVQDQHDRLREALRTKEALASIQKELDIATRVQLSLIPDDLELSGPFPASGYMTPAKEVGGDFFDLFRLDEKRIGVAIADVSGKGVPAALFMVMARTLLRSTVFHIDSPAAVLEYMNDYLEKNNDEQLFVTLFYGILDEANGTLTYSTGGHNPPIVADSKGTRVLEQTEGAVLALIDDLVYSETTVLLEDGSRIIMMTDGIPEAFNGEGEAFGDDRTLETIDALNPGQSPEEDIKQLVDAVEEFVGDAPQFDDITCVVLHYSAD